jgi:drug/metabolite transporter (DMT)-like permease
VHIIGAFVMAIGAFIVLSHGSSGFHRGGLLILLANALAPIGNYFQRRARRSVSSETILLFRSIGSTVLVFLIAAVVEGGIAVPRSGSTFALLAMNGVVIFGVSEIFWVEGIHRIAVAKANALSTVAPVVTLLLAWLFLGQPPTGIQITALAPMVVGVVLLTRPVRTSGASLKL